MQAEHCDRLAALNGDIETYVAERMPDLLALALAAPAGGDRAVSQREDWGSDAAVAAALAQVPW